MRKTITLFLYASASDSLKICIAFSTASTGVSINFPVLDEMTVHFFSSAFGTNSLPFSSELNNAMLQKLATERQI